jgi:hypothetical protein
MDAAFRRIVPPASEDMTFLTSIKQILPGAMGPTVATGVVKHILHSK